MSVSTGQPDPLYRGNLTVTCRRSASAQQCAEGCAGYLGPLTFRDERPCSHECHEDGSNPRDLARAIQLASNPR